MNIVFSKLVVENFLSIAKPVVWSLQNQGLVLITGMNQDSSVADSNGAGKSTLFEALLWCLWGKTIRGYTADDVVHRKVGKDCQVKLDFTVGGEAYHVIRARKHHKLKNTLQLFHETNDLTEHTVVGTQSTLEDLLGIDFDTFIRGPMMPQGAFKRFSQMSDSEIKNLLEQAVIPQMDFVLAQNRVKDAISEWATKKAAAETLFAETERALEAAKSKLRHYESNEEQFEDQKQESLGDLTEELEAGKKTHDDLCAELKSFDDSQVVLEKAKRSLDKVEQVETKLTRVWATKVEAARTKYREGQDVLRRLKWQQEELLSRQRRISELTGVCPTCEQPIENTSSEKVLLALTKELSKLNRKIKKLQPSEEELGQALYDIVEQEQQSLARAKEMVKQAREKVVSATEDTAEVARLEQKLEWTLQQVVKTKQAIESLQAHTSPYADLAQQTRDEIAEHHRNLYHSKVQIAACQQGLEYLEFWKAGFGHKGLKSFILRSVTPFMNARAAHYTKILSGGELHIEFQTHTQLKTGVVKDQFGVLVQNRNGADTYAGNSGGEKGRADLGINFVVSDVVSSRARKSFPQRFFDEPFEGLDEAGVDAVMDLLSDMVAEAGTIFVVTHQQGMQGLFTRNIQMVKEHGSSQMVM